MHRPIIALAMIPLAACTIAESKPVDGMPMAACRQEKLDSFLGQPASQELGARILAASGSRVIRWVPKGGAVTMDFRADRVTVALDEANRVERASCG
ncbi:peptidase inhibitor I78 [Sphingomonas sp. G124]|uniref:Peptidase inhibitor I78 n=1 Tax=Sphingomonas cremea TaxID=2904799 RepID=A0A9X1U4B6_9SPHN|nr:I78 family peptidase inhibitor [Sphingomonas cremea]MCF2514031.1 peptidase inhibitor I78 [Sphingomonas cremea]